MVAGSEQAKKGAVTAASTSEPFVARILDELKALEQRQAAQFESLSAQLQLLIGDTGDFSRSKLSRVLPDGRVDGQAMRPDTGSRSQPPHSPVSPPRMVGQRSNRSSASAHQGVENVKRTDCLETRYDRRGSTSGNGTVSAAAAAPTSATDTGLLSRARAATSKIIQDWPFFDLFFCCIILLNCITIGLESSHRMEGLDTMVFHDIEHAFVAIYAVELATRIFGLGWRAFESLSTKFDLFIVVVGIVCQWILLPIADVTEWNPAVLIEKLMLMRVLKVLTLVKKLRMIPTFKTTWTLVRGLFNTLDAMLATFVLLFLALYIFACLGADVIAGDQELRSNPETAQVIEYHFASLYTTMLTLVQVASMDSFAAIYYPLLKQKLSLWFFFGPLYIIVNISIMNLVTASLVEAAMHQSASEREADRKERIKQAKEMIPDIRDAFQKLDLNNDGSVAIQEIEECRELLPCKLAAFISRTELVELFDVLDIDSSGAVNEKEFVEGIVHVASSDTPNEMQLMLRMQEAQLNQIYRMAKGIDDMLRDPHPHFGAAHQPRKIVVEGTVESGTRTGRPVSPMPSHTSPNYERVDGSRTFVVL